MLNKIIIYACFGHIRQHITPPTEAICRVSPLEGEIFRQRLRLHERGRFRVVKITVRY